MLRGMMVDDVRLEIGEDAPDRLVADIHVHERDAVADIRAPPAAVLPERIDDEQLVAGGHVGIGDVRPDEAGPAGNDNPQERSFPWLVCGLVAGERRCPRIRFFSARRRQYSER